MIKTSAFLLIIFLAAPVWAGEIETAFCPDIPESVNFSDSPEDVISKTGREPDSKEEMPGKRSAYLYAINSPVIFDTSILGYFFKDGKLAFLGISASHNTATEDGLKQLNAAVEAFNGLLAKLYGPPRAAARPGGNGGEPQAQVWEFSKNALLVSPAFKFSDNSQGLLIIVCPLNPTGQYDLNDF